MWSATYDDETRKLMMDVINQEPVFIRVGDEDVPMPSKRVNHHFEICVGLEKKVHRLIAYIKEADAKPTEAPPRVGGWTAEDDPMARGSRILVFVNSHIAMQKVTERLRAERVDACGISSQMTDRQAVLQRFKKGYFPVLIATDVLQRGIDISGLTHVINFDAPRTLASYIHRVGRTGRLGQLGEDQEGTAFTLLNQEYDGQIADSLANMFSRCDRFQETDFAAVREIRDGAANEAREGRGGPLRPRGGLMPLNERPLGMPPRPSKVATQGKEYWTNYTDSG